MDKRPVRFHSPMVVVVSPSGKLFMGRYDNGYPFTLYREAFNPLGGNPTTAERDGGKGPLETLRREIGEEINPEAIGANGEVFATMEERRAVRDAVLTNLVPQCDLYINAPDMKTSGGRPAHCWISSAYIAKVGNTIMEIVAGNVAQGKRILTEGFAGVTDLESLASGRHRLAHSAALVLNHVLREGGRTFPCLIPGATEEYIGMPRESYKDYFDEFDYDPKAFRE